MGEVKVRVKLVNAGDETLVRRGIMKPEQVRSYETEAFVDTAAVRSVIPAHVRNRLGLAVPSQRVAEYADGGKEAVGLTDAIRFEILDRDTLDEEICGVFVHGRKHHRFRADTQKQHRLIRRVYFAERGRRRHVER